MQEIIQRIAVGSTELLALALGGAGVMFAGSFLSRLITSAPRALITSLTSLGFWMALSSPSGATPGSTEHPLRRNDAPEAPWSPAEGPPPLPAAGVRGSLVEIVSGKPQPHPAIHGGVGKISGPLFPRLDRSPSVCEPEREMAECMNRHPAGRGLKKPASTDGPETRLVPGAPGADPTPREDHSRSASPEGVQLALTRDANVQNDRSDHQGIERGHRHGSGGDLPAAGSRSYVVQRGDSLWGISEDILGTNNKAKVARYWPAIHRLNRETIGKDPNYLIPGQVLHLPDPTKV